MHGALQTGNQIFQNSPVQLAKDQPFRAARRARNRPYGRNVESMGFNGLEGTIARF
jgi:hypothetical protein